MFKRFLLALLLFSLFLSAGARVGILNPVSKALAPGETATLGKAMPGETLSITIDRNAYFHKWDTAWVDSMLLPQGWKAAEPAVEEKSIVLQVSIPAGARIGSQNLRITAENRHIQKEETVNAVVLVERGLVSAIVKETQQEAWVNSEACYGITLINNSIAPHSVRVSSSLPKDWFSALGAEVKAKDSGGIDACISANVSGSRDFYFHFDSALNGERFHSIRASVDVLPTAKGKYSAPLSGYPFFMPTLVPYYLINSFLSLLS